MRHLRTGLLLLGLITATSALAELRVYDVQEKYRQEVYTALRGVLRPPNQGASGQIEMLPTGQILIDTSAEMHEQVAAILEDINAYQVEATPRVTLRYWAVLGTHDELRDPAPAASDAVPEILSDVLDELRRVHGDLSFRLIGNATLVTESGEQGGLQGDPLTVNQVAWVQGSTLNAELSIRFAYAVQSRPFTANNDDGGSGESNPFSTISRDSQSVSLNTSIAQNEFVVVGENTIRVNTVDQGNLDGTLFYIVHWPVAP
jgi:hypothetical protein